MKHLIYLIIIAFSLIACSETTTTTIGEPIRIFPTTTDVNVAASANGGIATSTFNSSTTPNLIDGNTTTTWISDPDVPVVIDFSAVNNVKKITINKVNSSVNNGTNPDILVELSANGTSYVTSNITLIVGGDLACNSTTINSTLIECSMNEYAARYLRITSKNGKSFEFEEIEVISNK